MMEFYTVKILFFSALAFIFTIIVAPLLTHYLYKYKLGKKIRRGGETPIFSELHAHKEGTPTMGGVLIWGTVLIFILGFSLLNNLFPGGIFQHLNFLSRSETLLPLGALIISALIGLFDDWLDVRGKGVLGGGGLKMRHRLLIYVLIAIAGALWFYYKLDWTVFHVPFLGNFEIGGWYIPIFIFIIVATSFSVNETDGLDGLAGGTLAIAFAAYGVIAFIL
ncbi:MAG: hypothetical protein Q8N57_00940, partial [bacterium]|nr:hypothetical protein [bacterium]